MSEKETYIQYLDDLKAYIIQQVNDMRNKDLKYNMEQRNKMAEAHIQDMDILEVKIDEQSVHNNEQRQVISNDLEELKANMILHSDKLAEYLEERFIKLEKRVDEILSHVQALEAKHHV